MKIAISTDGNSVAAHFGRCPAYTLIDVEDGRVTARATIPNPGHQPGFIPRFLHEKGVDMVLTGGMGPRAEDIFQQLGIKTVQGVSGPVDDVIREFLAGTLESGPSACDHPHGDHQHETPAGPGQPVQPARTGVAETGTICVTSEGKTLDSNVEPRFGRCRYFIFVDTATMRFEAVDNAGIQASGGAGIQAGQLVASRGARAVLTGNVGPNAYQTLQAAGIDIYTGASGTVREAVENFKKGNYRKAESATAGAKSGMK